MTLWHKVLDKPLKRLALAILLSALAITTTHAQQEPQYISIHGSACQPANLGQSINFNTSWSQFGVRNVNALGSGRSFFVACPVVMTDDETAFVGPADVELHVEYTNHDGVNNVRCTGYRLAVQDAGFVKTVSVTDPQSAGFSGRSEPTIQDLVDEADRAFDGLRTHVVVICALFPQSGVAGVSFDHD